MDQECSICLEPIVSYAIEIPCHHIFHAECVYCYIYSLNLLKDEFQCPLCRTAHLKDTTYNFCFKVLAQKVNSELTQNLFDNPYENVSPSLKFLLWKIVYNEQGIRLLNLPPEKNAYIREFVTSIPFESQPTIIKTYIARSTLILDSPLETMRWVYEYVGPTLSEATLRLINNSGIDFEEVEQLLEII